jgi:hypothetical protein
MALPKQVVDSIREVEEIEKQLAGAPVTEEPEKPAEPEVTEVVEPVTPKAEEAPKEPAEPVVPEETWQQKYKTLKGMYDAEVPRLHAQLKDLTKRLDQIQSAPPAPKAEPKPAKQHEKLVTDEDVKEFGADLIEVQRKVAREVAMEFKDEIDTLRTENEELRKQLNQTGAQVSETSFDQRLHRLVPNFDEVNRDPNWIAWLNEVDPILRGPRLAIAQQAFERGDAEAVAHYVGMFEKSKSPTPPPAKSETQRELELQVQPTKNSTREASVQQGKVYTDADIAAAYRRIAALTTKGDLKAANKLEAEIDAAFQEGRVTA